MPRLYRVPVNLSITAANTDVDLLNLAPGADKPCRLVGWFLGQISEVGDSQEEGIEITLRHMTATVTDGSGGADVTGEPGDRNDTAEAFTSRVGDTTVATTSGTSTVWERIGWNLRSAPWERWIPEEARPRVGGTANRLLVRWETTVADTVEVKGVFYVEEL